MLRGTGGVAPACWSPAAGSGCWCSWPPARSPRRCPRATSSRRRPRPGGSWPTRASRWRRPARPTSATAPRSARGAGRRRRRDRAPARRGPGLPAGAGAVGADRAVALRRRVAALARRRRGRRTREIRPVVAHGGLPRRLSLASPADEPAACDQPGGGPEHLPVQGTRRVQATIRQPQPTQRFPAGFDVVVRPQELHAT
jgi:hypothetical protein